MSDDSEHLCLSFAMQEFLIDKYISESKSSRDDSSIDSSEKVFHTAFAKLQVDIKESEKDLSNLPAIRNKFKQVVDDADEKYLF